MTSSSLVLGKINRGLVNVTSYFTLPSIGALYRDAGGTERIGLSRFLFMAIDFLKTYLLGEDWYTVNPISQEQINTEIVFEILFKYSKRFKKEYKIMKKKSKNDRIS